MKERTNREQIGQSSTNFLKVIRVFLFCDITKIPAFGAQKGGNLL